MKEHRRQKSEQQDFSQQVNGAQNATPTLNMVALCASRQSILSQAIICWDTKGEFKNDVVYVSTNKVYGSFS